MRLLSTFEVNAIHNEQLALFGGATGIIDEGKLESALFRPANIANYNPDATLCDLAAALCYGIAINHPFLDGNKRTAFVAMAVFLELNGSSLVAPEVEVVEIMLGVAAGNITEAELSFWLEHNLIELN